MAAKTDPTRAGVVVGAGGIGRADNAGRSGKPLRWTCRSTRQLADALAAQGYRVSHQTVASLLGGLGYSLQGNQKTKEGSVHPDRDAQFRFIHGRAEDFQRRGQPVVSVDTKKKELVGDFKNDGREWRPKGDPEPVRVYDFVDKALGKANPYGVYDPAANAGWVSVGTDHDTPSLPWRRCGAGGTRWAACVTRRPRSCW